jgi:hypothetical protein
MASRLSLYALGSLLLLARNVFGLGVILPLYWWPNDDCSAWSPIVSAYVRSTNLWRLFVSYKISLFVCSLFLDYHRISSNPTVAFYIIINPNSGPGSGSTPDQSFQTCIPKLRASTNVVILGYLATGYGNKGTDAINSELSQYAGWGADYRPTGIFFDEVSNDSGSVSTYAGYSSSARSKGFSFVSEIN